VGRPAIIKSIVLESVLVLGAALVIGVGVGVLATSLALSSIPQFPQASVEIPISHALPVGWLITAAVTFAAIFAVIVATTPALIVGRLAYSPTAEADR
jgi:hypothetical protein